MSSPKNEVVAVSKISFDDRLRGSLSNLVNGFDASISLYLDGIPSPQVVVGASSSYCTRLTRSCTQLSPELSRVVEVVPLYDNGVIHSDVFAPICHTPCTSSPSSRIGNHFSLFVGAFSFVDARRGVATSVRLGDETTQQIIVVPKKRIVDSVEEESATPGYLPVSSFLEILDDSSTTFQRLRGDEDSTTFLTTLDPSETSSLALCKSSNANSLKPSWEVCEVLHFDPRSATFRVRMSKSKSSNGGPVEKDVTRACLKLENEESTNTHELKLLAASRLRIELEQRIRTDLFLDYWDSDVVEAKYSIPDDMIKRILFCLSASIKTIDAKFLNILVMDVKKACERAHRQAILEYLWVHPHFQRLLSPLSLSVTEVRLRSDSFGDAMSQQRRSELCGVVLEPQRRRRTLEQSLRWDGPYKRCIDNIISIWNEKYESIVLLDVSYPHGELVALPTFLRNARASLDVGMALMRMNLLNDIDVSMMSDLRGSNVGYTYVNIATYRESRLNKLFLFVQVFLSSRLRGLGMRCVASLIDLFQFTVFSPAVFSVASDAYYAINGVIPLKKAQLVIELKYIEGGTVKVLPEMDRIESGLLELVGNLIKELNAFSKPDVAIMSSLQLPAATMDVISNSDSPVQIAIGAMQRALKFATPLVENLVEAYGKHANLVDKFLVDEAGYFEKPNTSIDEVIERIEREVFALRKVIHQVRWTSPDLVCCGIFTVDCSHAKRSLLSLWEGKINQIVDMTEKRIYGISLQSVRICKRMKQRLVTRPTCVEELDELLIYSQDAKKAIALIREKEVVEVVSCVGLLERLQHSVADEVFAQAYQLVSWPSMIDEAMNESEALFVVERAAMAEELEQYKDQVRKLIRELDEGVVAMLAITEQEKSDVAVTLSRSLRTLTEEIEERVVVAVRRETMLGMEVTDFGAFLPVRSTFEALEQFWVTLADSAEHVQRFYDTPISDANADKMIECVERWRRLLRAATRSLRGFSPLFSLGRKHEHFIMQFEQATPIIEMLTQPGVRQIHWKEISKKLGLGTGRELLPSDPSVTVHRILAEGALDHIDEISAIVAQAATDFLAETKLEKMKSETRKQLLVFETLEMPAGQVNALSNSSEIVTLLDTFVVQSQHLHSRYNLQAGLAQAAAEWESLLLNMQETMTLWMSLQNDWLQLRPTILVPPDANSVVNGDIILRFRQVDDLFRQIIDELDRPNQNLFVVMSIETLPNRLTHVATQLRTIRDGILLLMDSKRAAFPRFYFLSDREMLTCLSALNIRAVMNLLQRMYPRLSGFDLFKGDVSGFVSSDGVRMRCDPVYPITSEPIEQWMKGMEACVTKALRVAIETCLADFSKTQAKVWLLRYSAQLIDVSLRIRYAMDLEEVLGAVGNNGLKPYLRRTSRLLEEYFHVSAAELSSAEHTAVANSIGLLLYCKEEVQAMIDDGVHTVDHLEGFPTIRTFITDGKIMVRLFHTITPYGNEFLGNYQAPVMTPVMFRSMRALLLSHVTLTKTILAGTGGSGKKQTMSDFAAYMGMFLWSVQCHEAVTIRTLAPLFRALIGVGGWMCLDDVHCLKPEVQTELCKLVAAINASQRRVTREAEIPLGKNGEIISLEVGTSFNVVATSAIPYQDLPSNLAFTFRPMFLQSVDFSVVAKTYLCSLGFEDQFVTLGDAIGSIFQQFHDVLPGVFSVRSIILTIRLARTIAAPDLNTKLVLALKQIISPALTHDEAMRKLFESKIEAMSSEHDALTASFAVGPEEFADTYSLVDFEKLMTISTNVIVYGPHFSGKTRMISKWGKTRNVVIVSPRTVTNAMFYGNRGSSSGLLAVIFKECGSGTENLLWLEDVNLQSHNSDAWVQCASAQRRVHMDNSTCIVMGSDTVVVATCTSLSNGSPSLVSRFSLFCSGDQHPWGEHLRLCSSMLEESEIPQLPLAVSIMEALIPPLVRVFPASVTLHEAASLAMTLFSRWFQYVVNSSTQTARLASDKLTSLMVQCCVFATAWSLGLRLESADRHAFEDAFQQAHEAVSSAVCQYDSTIEIYPPGDILGWVASANGWKQFTVDEATDSWCFMNVEETKQQRGWSLFARPANPSIHYAVELLLRCGQHVFLTGSEQSGKTHMARRCFVNPAPLWTSHMFTCNKDTSVSSLQESLLPRLQKRQSKIYGPSIGKQFILCVDDLHLGAQPDPQENELNSSCIADVLYFMAKRQRLSTVSLGVIQLRDTVFFATGLPTAWNTKFSRSAVEVRLSSAKGSQIIRYVWTLLERCSAHRNLADVGREASAFLIVAHDAFVRSAFSLQKSETRMSTSEQRPYVFLETLRRQSAAENGIVSGSSMLPGDEHDDAVDNDDESPRNDSDDETHTAEEESWKAASPLANPWVRLAEPNASCDVHRLFQALDATRRLIVGPIADTQVLRGVASEIYRVYSSEVETSRKQQVAEMVLDVAYRTFAANDRSLIELDDITASILQTTETNVLERLTGNTREKRISEWVTCFNKAPAVELTPLTTPFINVSQVSLTNSHGGLATFRNKLLLSYKLNQMIATSNGAPLSSTQLHALDNAVVAPTTKTMMTGWMLREVPELLAAIQSPESHVTLVGSQSFGIARLVRIAAAISDLPLCICQSESPNYNFDSWREDLRSLIRYAAKKAVRVAMFVPSAALSVPGVLCDIDSLIRSGNCASLFTVEEYSILLDTAKKTNSNAAAMDRVDPALELDARIRQQVAIITHMTSRRALQNTRMSYPGFASMVMAIHVGDRSDWSKLAYSDLVASSLMSSYSLRLPPLGSEDAAGNFAVPPVIEQTTATTTVEIPKTPTSPGLADIVQKHTLNLISDVDNISVLVCEIFSALAMQDDGIVEEQIVEYAQLVGYLQKKRVPEVLIKERQSASYEGIKTSIHACITRDNQSKKVLSPELDQLNDSISKLEKSVMYQTSLVEGHRKAFETLESSSMHMMTMIEGRKQQVAQLNATMEANLHSARVALSEIELKHIKALSGTIVPPARARVLMDAVYLIVNEEIPKSASTQQELWNCGRKLICDVNFLPRILSIGPDAPWLPPFDQLKPLMDNFDVARFGSFSPYAQAISDLITAIVASVAMQEKCGELEVAVSDARVEMLSLVDDLERSRDVLFVTSKKLDEDRSHLSELRDRRNFVFESLQNCEQRLIRLNRLAGFVDTFEMHMRRNRDQLETQRRCILGDILLVGARISILGCQTKDDVEDSLQTIKNILTSHNVPFSNDAIDTVQQTVLQQEPLMLAHQLLAIKLPQNQVALLASLTKRAFFRWPLFTATNLLFEECIVQQLRDSCVDCVITSASAPNIQNTVMECIRNGYGLLIRNFNGAEVMQKLKSVIALLPAMQQVAREGEAPTEGGDSLTVQVFGKVITVHSKFYMVFTMREARGELAMDVIRSMQQWLVVHRLSEGLSVESAVQHLITNHRFGSCVALMNEFRMRAKEQRQQMSEFYRGKFAAARLISERQESIADDEQTIAELGVEVGRMERSSLQMDRQRQMADNVLGEAVTRWLPTVKVIASILDTLRIIEMRFGRDPVDYPFFSDIVEGAYVASPFMQEVFKAERVTGVPDHEQPRMVLVCFVEHFLHVFRPGWPKELAWLLTLMFVSMASNAKLIGIQRRKGNEDPQQGASEGGGESEGTTVVSAANLPLTANDVADLVELLSHFSNNGDSGFHHSGEEPKGMLMRAAIQLIEGDAFDASPGLFGDPVRLFEAILRKDLVQANLIASRLAISLGSVFFGTLPEKDGVNRRLPFCLSLDLFDNNNVLLPLLRFCSSANAAIVIETNDVPLKLEELQSSAAYNQFAVEVTHINVNLVDTEPLLNTMAMQVRLRPTKERRGHWRILVIEPCAAEDVEIRASTLQHISNALPLLKEQYYTSVCNNIRPSDESMFITIFVIDPSRVPSDVEVIVRSKSLHLVNDVITPQHHIVQLLSEQSVVKSDSWHLPDSHPLHFKIYCLLKGLVLLHAHEAHRQRTDRWKAKQYRTDTSMFVMDRDLESILSVLLRGLQHGSTICEPFTVLRNSAILLYASRCVQPSEEDRLLKVVLKFVHKNSAIRGGFKFMDVFESDPEDSIEKFLIHVKQYATDLCEISGDVLASENLVRVCRQRAGQLLSGDPILNRIASIARRKSLASTNSMGKSAHNSVTAAQRSRRSVFVPDAPSYRRSIARLSRRFTNDHGPLRLGRANSVEDDSINRVESHGDFQQGAHSPNVSRPGFPEDQNEEEETVACWDLEIKALERAMAASKEIPGLLELRVMNTLRSLLHVSPTHVKAMWLPALQYPKLFLYTFMDARAQEAVQKHPEAVYATFALICLSGEDRVRSDDLVLSSSVLPEKRLRNQSEVSPGQKRNSGSSVDTVSIGGNGEERQPWVIEEDECVIVLRACPRSVVPTTTIPMLRTDNIPGRMTMVDDENDTIDIVDGVAMPQTTSNVASPTYNTVGSAFMQSSPLHVVAEKLESAKDQLDTADLLTDEFIGGSAAFSVFISRVDVPLMCSSIVPQTGKRRWRMLLSLPLLVERRQAAIMQMETRRQSVFLRSASTLSKGSPLVPTIPSVSRNASKMRPRRTTTATVDADDVDEAMSKKHSVAASAAATATPSVAVNRFYWLPIGLQYSVNAE